MKQSKLGIRLLILSFVLILVLFLLSPVQLGPVRDFRFMYYMWETGLLEDHRTPEQLIASLQSEDIRVQVDALMTMSRMTRQDRKIVRVLQEFIDTKAPYSLQNLAVYALGELRVRECVPQLESRLGDDRYDQEVLKRALERIAGTREKPIWKSIF